ncbi:hypothetical protein jhhlp_003010 [Lomentospora prolificans]|uniref:Uncharacterized protein n=1 Tax=Lomentospora prolificans TaxID=41688 RepID=A0A2N3NFM8_9PEZI|nr:hypothetical protein jhhlp_003010 [Lomentospora prolificans]
MADDVPLALRRTRRTSTLNPEASIEALPFPEAITPRRTRKRRVRFSDPGPSTNTANDEDELSTGLTPMVNRTSLKSPAPKRRRVSTPARLKSVSFDSPSKTEVINFEPIRQVLDERTKRRIRRNGLSEEMNSIESETRRRARETKAEIERLKAELKAKDLEIYQLQNATIIVDTERIWELEKQVADLKSELAERSRIEDDTRHDVTMAPYEWTVMARDPFNPDYSSIADEDEVFGDATMADIQCSTPSRVRASFPTPPLTSPAAPATPSRRFMPVTPQSHTGVQVSFPDLAKKALEEELSSMRNEMGKLNNTLESYRGLTARLNERLIAHQPEQEGTLAQEAQTPEKQLESRIDELLRAFSDRTAALLEITSSLSQLGFPGDDASAIITSLAAGFRTARLELEYLSPGEITLPLTSRGAEVLDLLLSRLRELAKRAQEDENTIDEYHELELSLRKQLSSRVDVMDELKSALAKAQATITEKTTRIQELEVGVGRLRGAVDGYVRDIHELEQLVENMETESREKGATHAAELESKRRILVSKEDRIAELEVVLDSTNGRANTLNERVTELEAKLTESVAQTEKLQAEVAELVASKAEMGKRHGETLALRDARVTELKSEIERVNGCLRAAYSTVQTLRVGSAELETKMGEERERAKRVIDSMRDELQRVVQMSQEFLEASEARKVGDTTASEGSENGSDKGESTVGRFFAACKARRWSSAQQKRKRPDSGLGLLEEDEVDF